MHFKQVLFSVTTTVCLSKKESSSGGPGDFFLDETDHSDWVSFRGMLCNVYILLCLYTTEHSFEMYLQASLVQHSRFFGDLLFNLETRQLQFGYS